jgi:hypothetical protein
MKLWEEKNDKTLNSCAISNDQNIHYDLLNEKLNNSYNTITDYKAKSDVVIFISDIDQLKEFQKDFQKKMTLAILCFALFLIIECSLHFYYSYFNLLECQNKFNNLPFNPFHFTVQHHHTKKQCASNIIHLFMIVGYFTIGFITISRQSKISFEILEIYILIMCITDLFFSFENPRNLYFVFEEIMNFFIVKYLRYLRDELNKVSV